MYNPFFKTSAFVVLILISFACKKNKEQPEPPTSKGWVKKDGPVLKRSDPFAYDFYALSDCWVLRENGIYKMWYTGGGAVAPDTILHSNIGYATSTDGIHWTKYVQNPVLDITKTSWDSIGVETVTVIIDENAPLGERYKLWYAGQTFNDHRYEIGYAYSGDGIHWTKHTGPVLAVGTGGEWDNGFLEGPSVIKEGNTYKMWYAAFDEIGDGQTTDFKVSIGYATSNDGISWTKHAAPVLLPDAGQWDAVYVQDPHVIKYKDLYHMWYGGTKVYDNYFQQTGYAYSNDGINWTKSGANPVLARGNAGSWDANTSSFPSVLIEETGLKMWYTGKDVEPLSEWPSPYYWDLGLAEKILPEGAILD